MKHLSIDLETFSATDLTKAGVYRYTEDPTFQILLFGYSIDGASARVIDLASGEHIPADILQALMDAKVVKSAFNAAFERICLSAHLRRHHPDLLSEGFLDPAQWPLHHGLGILARPADEPGRRSQSPTPGCAERPGHPTLRHPQQGRRPGAAWG